VKGDGGRANVVATEARLAELGVDIAETGRGGDVTYHGPGQIVGYPILDLRPDRCDVHRYVRDIEEVMIRVCGDYGLRACRITGLTGAWVETPTDAERADAEWADAAKTGMDMTDATAAQAPTTTAAAAKIGAIGVRISRWITSHGFAFNVSTALEHFNLIVPCGITDRGVTSLERAVGRPVPIADVEDALARHFAVVFDRDLAPVAPIIPSAQ
jgi:lipoyl(octanoyl) transferase